MTSKSSSISPSPIHVSGIEGVSAEGEIAVAENPAHLEPLATIESVQDDVDGEEFGERRPKIGRRPYIPTKAEVCEHIPFMSTTGRGARIALRADKLRTRSRWE